MHWLIVGSGINGLVAANYLARAGHQVTILERNAQVGGACSQAWHIEHGQRHSYAHGATVLGLMQRFIFEETGLSKHLRLIAPSSPEVVHIAPTKTTFIGSATTASFEQDLERVSEYLQTGFYQGKAPTLEEAYKQLGSDLTKRWIQGSARDLLNHYFQEEEHKLFHAMCVNESGPVLLNEPYSAFSIPLMYSGTIFDGNWGYVQGGIWQITRVLKRLNQELRVTILTKTNILSIDEQHKKVVYQQKGTNHIATWDHLLFATDPLTAARLIQDELLIQRISKQRLTGTSGKLVLFFRAPVQWNDGNPKDAFRQVILTPDLNAFDEATASSRTSDQPFVPGYIEYYPEGNALSNHQRRQRDYRLTLYFKHVPFRTLSLTERDQITTQLLKITAQYVSNMHDIVATKLLTPIDIKEAFFFPEGNIDHIELASGQTFATRTYSPEPNRSFYQFGEHTNIFYAGSGAYPCGSVTGTPGYMCVRPWI